jgi:DNA processing protein
MRNRIVAGWGTGVLVVEAAHGSGALITATQAIEQGRNVYAVPGPIDRPTSAGSNRLIQQGAKLVTNAADILDDLSILIPRTPREQPAAPSSRAGDLKPEQQLVYDAISDTETAIDLIIARTNLPSGRVSSTLLLLEMKHLVKQLPGQHFVRLGPAAS